MQPLRFMTFNVRFDTLLDEARGHRWSDRFASVLETVESYSPDVVGFQEAVRSQLDDLVGALPGYRGLGKPREVGEAAEYVPLFFSEDRLELEQYGDFWLSSSPEVEGSMGWDAGHPRHCTWAILQDKESEAGFATFNTHLDNWGKLARLEAARLIVTRVGLAPGLPAVVLGDFNAEEDSEPVKAFLEGGFRDTFRELNPEATDVRTFHDYSEFSGPGKIDYILCDHRWKVLAADILRAPAAGRFPSDHYPVVAELLPIPERDAN